jgi:hypothetical protein
MRTGENAHPPKLREATIMTDNDPTLVRSPADAVDRCQTIFAHAWMVRTFVKHSETVEEFPELMQLVRTVFDTSRALEPKVAEPLEYLATLRKKIGKLRAAAEQFRTDAPVASDHTNFKQAVISMDGCVAELEAVLKLFPAPAPPAMPANFRPVAASGNVVPVAEPPVGD